MTHEDKLSIYEQHKAGRSLRSLAKEYGMSHNAIDGFCRRVGANLALDLPPVVTSYTRIKALRARRQA